MRKNREWLRKADATVPLRIRRGDAEMDVEVPLSYSFEYPAQNGRLKKTNSKTLMSC